MQMKEIEIVGKYNRATNKKEQITILAQLNGCSEEDIRKVLTLYRTSSTANLMLLLSTPPQLQASLLKTPASKASTMSLCSKQKCMQLL